MFIAKRMGIAAAIEAVYGTDVVPTAALNAILAENVNIDPMEGDEITEEYVRPNGMGAFEKYLINKHVKLSFDVRLRGSGAAGTAPAIAPLLKSSGWAETLNVGTDATYNLVSANEDSASIYLFRGGAAAGVRHTLLGARGSWKLAIDVKKHLMVSFEFIGLYADPTSVAMPATFDFSGFKNQPIVPVNKANTTFTLGGVAAVLEKLDMDSGRKLSYNPYVNYEEVENADRQVTGSMTIREPEIGTTDYFSTAYPNTMEVMAFENGLTPGQIFHMDAARVQRGRPKLADSNGYSALDIPLTFLPSDAGNDLDLVWVFK